MSKYIEFEPAGDSPIGKTKRWSVVNKHHGDTLGCISWYGPWRQYVFEPLRYALFSHDCLLAISRFCYSANQEHRRARKTAGVK